MSKIEVRKLPDPATFVRFRRPWIGIPPDPSTEETDPEGTDPAPPVAGSGSSVAGSGSLEYGLSNTTWFGPALPDLPEYGPPLAKSRLFLAKSRLLPVTLVPGVPRHPGNSCSRGAVPLEFPCCFLLRSRRSRRRSGIHGNTGNTGNTGDTRNTREYREYTGIHGNKARRAVRPVGPYTTSNKARRAVGLSPIVGPTALRALLY